jgi:O-antigen/teichoic acid export membrane protein
VLSLLSLPVLAVVSFAGPSIFSAVFGRQWLQSGMYMQIIVLWVMFNFVCSPLTVIPQILKKQKSFLFWSIGYNIFLLGVFLATAVLSHSFIISLAMLSLAAASYLTAVIFWLLRQAKEADNAIPN